MKLQSRLGLSITTLAILFAGTATVLRLSFPTSLFLVLTESVPLGLYRLFPQIVLKRGAFVLINIPEGAAKLVDERDWLSGVPLTKEIGALAGDYVCVTESAVFVNGAYRAPVFEADHAGLPLPRYRRCKILSAEEVFLLSTRNPHSFDSRYFGPVNAKSLIGEMRPIFTFNM